LKKSFTYLLASGRACTVFVNIAKWRLEVRLPNMDWNSG